MFEMAKKFFGIRTDHIVVRSTEVGNGVVLMAMRGGSADGQEVLDRAAEAGALISICDSDGKFIGYVPKAGMGSLGRGQNERVNQETLKIVGNINSGINSRNYNEKVNDAIDRNVGKHSSYGETVDETIKKISDFSEILRGSVGGQTYEQRVEEILKESQEP